MKIVSLLSTLCFVGLLLSSCGVDPPSVVAVAHFVDGDPCAPGYIGEPPANGTCPAYDAAEAVLQQQYSNAEQVSISCSSGDGWRECRVTVATDTIMVTVDCVADGMGPPQCSIIIVTLG